VSLVSRYLEPNLIERLNHLQLSARSVVEGSTIGLHRSPVKGASIEFRQHRFYVPGDEPRRLDWRVLARTDRPYIKEYDEETNLRGVLMLDCSGSMRYVSKRAQASKFDFAARLVASLAYLMLGQTESVGLGGFGHRLEHWLAPHAGTQQLSRLIETLERLSPQGRSDAGAALRALADRIGRRSLVIIVSDFFTPAPRLLEGLARLRHARHEVIALRVLDRDEIDFPFRRWSRFNGLEGERPYLCEPAMVRKRYLDSFQAHTRQLHDGCRSAGVELHTFMTDKPMDDALANFLVRRKG
jgi:uncharacterized protein (DUF58 family)